MCQVGARIPQGKGQFWEGGISLPIANIWRATMLFCKWQQRCGLSLSVLQQLVSCFFAHLKSSLYAVSAKSIRDILAVTRAGFVAYFARKMFTKNHDRLNPTTRAPITTKIPGMLFEIRCRSFMRRRQIWTRHYTTRGSAVIDGVRCSVLAENHAWI